MATNDKSQACLGLAKAKEGPTTHVDKNLRLSADPEEVTGGRAIGDNPGSTRTQDLHSYWISHTALS